jgi:hypothetical protein
MMIRVVHVYVAALVIMTFALITHPPEQNDIQIPETFDTVGEYQRDYWSLNCSEGTYLVVGENGSSCEVPGKCGVDDDCKYIDVDSLPARTGYCVNATCKAYCGRGTLWKC